MQKKQEAYHPFKSIEAKEKYLRYYDEHAKHWPIASEKKMVKTSFGQTFVRISGPKEGYPLVLIHGDTENSLAWIPTIEKLSLDYRTYALDNIYDNGRSIYSRPIKKPNDFVDWLDELFIALKLKHINLLGFSYGGWIATLYALSFPQRLNKLILLAPTVISPSLSVMVYEIIQHFIPIRSIVKRYLYWYNADSVRKEKTRQVINYMIEELLLSIKCFKGRGFVSPTVITDQEWQNLEVPTLLLLGENEVTYSAQKAIKYLNTIAPNVKTSLTTDVGHDLVIVKPEWIINEVLKFLEEEKVKF